MSTFNILLLEDDPIRVTQFRARLAQIDHVLEHYESSHDTVNALRTRTYDLILLDHDLGGEVYVDPAQEEDCGMRVAEFFAANPAEVRKHGPIIIHSLNSPAAEQMLSLIGEAAYIPYVWQREVWNKYINIK